MSDLKTMFVALVLGWLKNFLQQVAQNLWDNIWAEIIKAAIAAEKKWDESGQGAAKREWVVDQIVSYINEKADLNWVYKKLVVMGVGMLVDSLIAAFNNEMGQNWGEKIAEYEDMLDDKIPFID